ncbi:potassium/proton antiporter [Desulfotomaculum sp. 1211_IL3151]|uniref:potassium/proton antiporter n=1 Tax=Desulfotomaculum sp. 1211_IL3151 TaxID=3084055 RepID=UPI002FD8E76D
MIISADSAIFLFSLLLVAGVLTTKFSSRLGVPYLVLYVVVGMVMNKYLYYDNAALTQLFGILALIVILFEGGMQTKWQDVKPVIVPSASLATFGVLITTFTIGIFAKYVLDVSWLEAFLFGSIVGSTDAAAVFSVMGTQNIKRKLSSTLEAESGSNDPMAVFLTITFISLIQTPETAKVSSVILSFVLQMGLGLLIGLTMGKFTVWSINKINLDSSGLYPVLALGFAIFTYGSAAVLKGSGLLAVYVMAVYVGNSDLTFRHSIFRFNEGFAWMMQILMFILLGLLSFPTELVDIAWQGVLLAFLLVFIARPIGVFLTTIKMGFTFRDKIFLSWSGLKGAVPIVLATYPIVAGLDNSHVMFNIVFFVVFISALVQGSTISLLANKLGLSAGEKITSPHSLELISMGKTNSEIIEINIKEDFYMANKEIRDLDLPESCLITAVVRDTKVITPRGTTELLAGDILYVLTPKSQRKLIKKIFRQKDNTPLETASSS